MQIRIKTWVRELSEPIVKGAQAKVKLADKMLMLLPLFDGEKPEKTKTHEVCFYKSYIFWIRKAYSTTWQWNFWLLRHFVLDLICIE